MTLKDLPIGKTATIKSVGGEGALRQHFLDMGLIPKGEVTMVKYAPMGDPMELRIHSYELTLRLADAEKIEIEDIRDADQIAAEKNKKQRDRLKMVPLFRERRCIMSAGFYHQTGIAAIKKYITIKWQILPPITNK